MEHPPVDVSVIIVSWNVRNLLEECLLSLRKQSGIAFEIFVIDNGSRDDSAGMVRERFPEVHLIDNKQNAGFAAANNQGIKLSRGRVMLLLNPDTVVHEGTLKKTVEYFDTHPDVGILGCRIQNRDGSLQHSVRRNPTLLSQVLVLCKLHVLAPRIPAIQKYLARDFDYDKESDVEQVMGAFLAFRSTLLQTVGLLDDGYFLWFEEVDYCKRVQKFGSRIRFVPSITMTHAGGESFGQLLSIEQQMIFNRSMLRYFRKHHSLIAFCCIVIMIVPSLLLTVCEPLVKHWYAPKPL